ncbi:receptor-type tyrosine-protein phosphatase alpha isoform X2 [Nematostella vectensis]|uniref:receptor-type tyrosine-protein phosphatase alpha isoform X2 n=1 Tax=Nematostella vectensis TaxID=45351 RepID=UPI0020778710|nr:receptor-type tyrosine-protein phosphatase alpha isoform X2 [Nematostella vectensis]
MWQTRKTRLGVVGQSTGFRMCLSRRKASYLLKIFFLVIVLFYKEVNLADAESVDLGEKAVLNCSLGAFNLTRADNKPLPQNSYQDGSLLHIPHAQCSSSGTYVCNNTNSTANTQLTVKGPPGDIDITIQDKTSSSASISWSITSIGCWNVSYSIRWEIYNEPNTTNRSVGYRTSYRLTDLKPYKKYALSLKAMNKDGEKWKNDLFWTDIAAPSEPYDVTAYQHNAVIVVRWKKPHNENGPLDQLRYKLVYKNTVVNDSIRDEVNISTPSYNLSNVLPGTTYQISVQACNSAGCSESSRAVNVTTDKKGDNNSSGGKGNGDDSFPSIAVVVISIILVAVVICVVLFLRHYYHCKMPLRGFFSFEDAIQQHSSQRIGSYRRTSDKHEPIPYEAFRSHVKHLHADCDYKFFMEFEALQGVHEKNKRLTWVQSQKPENQMKNRFANVVAYDHSRVVLSLTENDQSSHYINANYVDTYNAMNAYIATQGPLAKTISDFWRMIWEQNCRVIVMITNIIEKGRHKCAMYWPTKNRKTENHGPLTITFVQEETFAYYSIRTFEIKPNKDGTHYTQYMHGTMFDSSASTNMLLDESLDPLDDEVKPMMVKQFHFTGWPDHGAPEPGFEFPVLDLIMKSTACVVPGTGPLVVHCSAGVGRSGAFIVIDSMIKRIHDNGDLDIFNFLAHIRNQRNHLVQEECQYIFIHDTLAEYIACNFVISLPIKALKDHVRMMRMPISIQPPVKSKLDLEYERIQSIKIKEYNLKEVKKPCNITKNRSHEVIPVDSSRVRLYPRPGEEGSDYINASYIDGFTRREAFIATQHPLQSTTMDYWRMIWQENCRSIVMLLSEKEWDKDVFPSYLPAVHDTAHFGDYEVTMESETARGDFIIRDLKLISTKDPSVIRQIRHFHFLHWPEHGQPWSGQTVLQLVSKVEEWESEVEKNSHQFDIIGPIVVHCNNGIGRTGVYCALHALWQQIAQEKLVSVYQTAWLQGHQRPKFLPIKAQYEMLYDTLIEYIDADCSLYLV